MPCNVSPRHWSWIRMLQPCRQRTRTRPWPCTCGACTGFSKDSKKALAMQLFFASTTSSPPNQIKIMPPSRGALTRFFRGSECLCSASSRSFVPQWPMAPSSHLSRTIARVPRQARSFSSSPKALKWRTVEQAKSRNRLGVLEITPRQALLRGAFLRSR
jgi:hypothetical protein